MAKCVDFVTNNKWSRIICSVTGVLFIVVGVTILTIIGSGGSQYNIESSPLTSGADFNKPPNPYQVDSAVQGRVVRHVRNRNRDREGGSSQTEMPTGSTQTSDDKWTRSTTMRPLPVNATQKHPVSLLYEMGLQPNFNVTHCTLNRRKVVLQSFKATVTLAKTNTTYGPEYGRNTREAKRRVAEVACFALFKLTFAEPVRQNPDHLQLHTSMCDS